MSFYLPATLSMVCGFYSHECKIGATLPGIKPASIPRRKEWKAKKTKEFSPGKMFHFVLFLQTVINGVFPYTFLLKNWRNVLITLFFFLFLTALLRYNL